MTGAAQFLAGLAAAGAGASACGYYATYAVRSQWLGRAEWRAAVDRPLVSVTFDDGPTEDTERILDTLAAYDVRAAFFMIGRQVARHPRIARRVVAGGHEVGNHSYSHPIYLYRSARRIFDELMRTQEIIADVTGVRPIWARPPCGVRTPAYFRAARALRLRTVQWTVAGFDWKHRRAERITHDVLRNVGAGAIILLHDGDHAGRANRRATAASLPAIIDGLEVRALGLAPLAELLDA